MYLSFYHHNIFIQSNKKELLEKLKDEFNFFSSSDFIQQQNIFFRFNFLLGPSPSPPPSIAKKILEKVIIYQVNQTKYLDYHGRALSIQDEKNHLLTIYAQDLETLFELAYLSIHSIVGKYLEKKGFIRIHALGISYNDNNVIVMLPSGGGKSTLLSQLLSHQDIKIISDDTPFVDLKGRIYSFPGKISLLNRPHQQQEISDEGWVEFKRFHYPPKWCLSLSKLKHRIEDKPHENKTFLLAGYRLSEGKSQLRKVSKHQMIKPLMEHMILGVGLPQIIELFLHLTWKDLYILPAHFIIRLISALQLVLKSDCYHLYLGKDLKQNKHLILDLLHEQKKTNNHR